MKKKFLFRFPVGTDTRKAWAYLKENDIDADLSTLNGGGIIVKTFDDGSKAVTLLNKGKFHYSNISPLYKTGATISGALSDKGVDLFEDYDQIPEKLQRVLGKHQKAFVDEDYKGLEKALKDVNKLGYTFEYYLDGQAYDLRKIGQKGKTAVLIEEYESDKFAKGSTIENKIDFSIQQNKDDVTIVPLTFESAEFFANKMMKNKFAVYRKEILVDYYSIGNILEDAEQRGLKFNKPKFEKGGNMKGFNYSIGGL